MAEPDDASTGADDAAPAKKGVGESRRWLAMLKEAEDYFQTYQDKCDNIDKQYADLEKMANTTREREMQVFWANLEVLKPSIYSRPPVPVVVPRFKDRKPLPRVTAEMLERAVTTSFSIEDVDATMRLIRDDLATSARGVPWLRYEAAQKGEGLTESVAYDHIDRKDFLHEPARKWNEVGWVAKRAYLNRKDGIERFGDVWMGAEFKAQDTANKDDDNNYKGEQKAAVWELWHKGDKTVVWVTAGVDEVLDQQDPYLTLEGFFPCPRPVYGTLQRRSLLPVPDFLYYKDQIEEINELTARISALAEALRLKGFYAAGAGEVADAVEAALKAQSNNAILVPVSNFAALGGQALKDSIVWLPVKDIAEVIKGCIELRKQLIDDVYQITGLSDIMRGATDPNETLGAQELKSQYGSIRIRDRQAELVRIARDMTRMAAEIMAENFSPETLLAMTQMEVPTARDIAMQAQQIKAQKQQIVQTVQQAVAHPQAQQIAQQQPDQAKAALEQAQQQIQGLDDQLAKLQELPTVEKIMALLRSERARPFSLDIETDSTIAPDEDAQKKRATEFVTAVGGFMGQAVPLAQTVPQLAPLIAEFLKYTASQFRAGRAMEGVIDEFADQMAQASKQPQGPSPEAQVMQAKMKADEQAHAASMQQHEAEMQGKQQSAQLATQSAEHDRQLKERVAHQTMAQAAQKHEQDMQKGELEIHALRAKIGAASTDSEQVVKPPSTSIPFEALPPEGKAQLVKFAGLDVQPSAFSEHDANQAANAAALKATAPPKQPAAA